MTSGDEDFLARWSRRKGAARAGDPEAEAPAAPAPGEAEPAAPGVPPGVPDERSDDEILADLGLPDPESLGPGADFRPFMAAVVPARIRNRALRVLWRSDPRLANLDGLVDHAEDFSDKATVVRGMQTAYQVGRGMLRRVAEQLEAEPPSDSAAAAPESPEPQAKVAGAAALESAPAAPEEPPQPAARPPRRMRFGLADSGDDRKTTTAKGD